MFKDFLLNMFSKNPGKIIGIFAGFVLSLMILLLGFFRTLLIALLIFAGYYIGKKIDNKEDWMEFLDRILPSGWNK